MMNEELLPEDQDLIEQREELIENIEEWKEIYEQVLATDIGGHHFIYRPLSRFEFRRVEELDISDADKEEILCSIATLYPYEYDFSNAPMAGIPTLLCMEILESSSLSSPQQALETLEEYRMQMLDLDNQMDCIIKEAFPEFDLEDMPHWTMKQAFYYFSRAEWILANLRGVRIPISNVQPQHNASQIPPHIQNQMTAQPQQMPQSNEREYPPEYYNLPPEFRDQDSTKETDFPEVDFFSED